LLDAALDRSIDAAIAAEIDDAVGFAEKSPFPPREDLMRNLYA